MEKAIDLICDERQRQDEKWGSDRHLDPLLWLAILGEEFGEVARISHQAVSQLVRRHGIAAVRLRAAVAVLAEDAA